MIVCRGCLLVHIPKSAGISMQQRMRDTNEAVFLFRNKDYHDPHLPPDWQRTVLGEQLFDALWVFGFVRNPWDRLVSLYHFKKKLGLLPRTDMTFVDFVPWTLRNETRVERYLQQEKLFNFIGRFERIEEHWPIVAAKLNLSDAVLPRLNVSNHNPYQTYYNSRLVDMVAAHEPTLIAEYKYEFSQCQ